VSVDRAGHNGSVRVRPRESFEAKQKIPYYLGISGTTAGATSLSLNLVVVPARSKAEPHTHSEFESAIYVISGRRCITGEHVIPFRTPHG